MSPKYRWIIFSAAEILPTLDGRKTQTRRVIKPQPPKYAAFHAFDAKGLGWFCHDGELIEGNPWRCPYGQPGDRLWVKETWAYYVNLHDSYAEHVLRYKADNARCWHEDAEHIGLADGFLPVRTSPRWRSSIHMPRWASRITLELTRVRMERVQDISEEDARAEGIYHKSRPGLPGWTDGAGHWRVQPRYVFEDLWNSLHAKSKPSKRNPYTHAPERCKVAYPWDDVREKTRFNRKASPYHDCYVYVCGNPWVQALTFKRGN